MKEFRRGKVEVKVGEKEGKNCPLRWSNNNGDDDDYAISPKSENENAI